MSAHIANIEAPLTPEQSLLADQIGNEVYSAHYAERKTYRLVIACGAVLLCGSMWMNFALAHRPIANRYVRIDEMGRAQAIQYTDLNYSPREGEVRTYLTDWANYRFTVNRDVIDIAQVVFIAASPGCGSALRVTFFQSQPSNRGPEDLAGRYRTPHIPDSNRLRHTLMLGWLLRLK